MKLLYFGILSELAGKQTEEITLEGTVKDLRLFLNSTYPSFSSQNFQVAMNQKIVTDQAILEPESEVALLPPFAGG